MHRGLLLLLLIIQLIIIVDNADNITVNYYISVYLVTLDSLTTNIMLLHI